MKLIQKLLLIARSKPSINFQFWNDQASKSTSRDKSATESNFINQSLHREEELNRKYECF